MFALLIPTKPTTAITTIMNTFTIIKVAFYSHSLTFSKFLKQCCTHHLFKYYSESSCTATRH